MTSPRAQKNVWLWIQQNNKWNLWFYSTRNMWVTGKKEEENVFANTEWYMAFGILLPRITEFS